MDATSSRPSLTGSTSRPTIDEYVQSLAKLSPDVDPTIETDASLEIQVASQELAALPQINHETLSAWVEENPSKSYVIGLTLGMSQERLENTLRENSIPRLSNS